MRQTLSSLGGLPGGRTTSATWASCAFCFSFFFSSRRRHTRLVSDWSSDVCSSDLAQGLGLAQGATDYALEYAKHRETMGKPIAQHQLVAAMLADMETKCEAARGLLYKCGLMIDEGAPADEITKISAMAKLYCTDAAMDVTTDAVQVLGGYGYMREYPVERMMRDAKITQIYEGTNQIQRLVIARQMLKENRAFLLAS